jgi:hypothetical protein
MVVSNAHDNSDKRRYPPGKARGSPSAPRETPPGRKPVVTDPTDILVDQVLDLQADGQADDMLRFSSGMHCPESDLRYAEPTPSLFSFNSAM